MPTFESRYNTSKLNYKTKHRNSYAHTRNIVLLSIYAKKTTKQPTKQQNTGKSDSFQETMINHIYKITLKIFHVPKK